MYGLRRHKSNPACQLVDVSSVYVYASFKKDLFRNGDLGSANAYHVYIFAVHLGSAVDTWTRKTFVVESFRDAKRRRRKSNPACKLIDLSSVYVYTSF